MAATITASDVKNDYSTSVSDTEIALLISIVDGANTCLDANSVASDTQKVLKIYAVRHLLAMQENDGRGKAVSEQAPSGAGRSFQQKQGEGVMATRYGSMLKQLDKYGCVTRILENTRRVGIRSIGRRDPDVTRPTYGS